MELWIIFIFTTLTSAIGILTGGTGLVITPLLMLFGVPPVTAVASFRVGTVGSSLSAFFEFHRNGKINYKLAIPITLFSLIGAYVGTRIVFALNQVYLKKLIGGVILFILFMMLVNPSIGVRKKKGITRIAEIFGAIITFVISIILTVIGGGGGVLYSFLFMRFYGQTLLESAGTRRIVNGIPIIFASVLFLFSGVVDLLLALVIFAGSLIGGWIGSVYFINKGDQKVRWIFMVVVLLLAIFTLLR